MAEQRVRLLGDAARSGEQLIEVVDRDVVDEQHQRVDEERAQNVVCGDRGVMAEDRARLPVRGLRLERGAAIAADQREQLVGEGE